MNNIVEIREVKSKNEWSSFKSLPWVINKDDKKWVPPLKLILNELFNLKSHPFWSTVSHGFFISGKVIKKSLDRIACISPPNKIINQLGYWGFLKRKDDAAIFNSLLKRGSRGFIGRKRLQKNNWPFKPPVSIMNSAF